MKHKRRIIVDGRWRHSTGRKLAIRESGERCQYRRRNARGGWADPLCEHSDEDRDVVGTHVSATECLWCALDCRNAPVDDEPVPVDDEPVPDGEGVEAVVAESS